MPKYGKMDIYFNDTQFVRFIFDPLFYYSNGHGQYALYECVAENDEAEHYATVYLPIDLSTSDLIGTVAHEAARAATDRHQTAIATMAGKIVTGFMERT